MNASAKMHTSLLAAAVLAAALAAGACTIGGPGPGEAESGQAEERIAFAASRNGNSEIYTIKPDGTDLRQITDHTAYDSWPAWSPDGTRIAFISDREGGPNIYTVTPGGADIRQLTRSGIVSQDANLVWSPDGTRIAFTAINQQIYAAAANGTLPRQVTPNTGAYTSTAWSPDGTRIAFASVEGGNSQIQTIAPDGTGLTSVLPAGQSGTFPAWSPNGQRILFRSDRTEGTSTIATLHLVAPDGTALQQILADGQFNAFAAWSPDGTRIALASTSPGNTPPEELDIYIAAADGTGRQLIYRGAGPSAISWTALAVGSSGATLIAVPPVTPAAPALPTPDSSTVSTVPATPAAPETPATPPATTTNTVANHQPQVYSGKVVSIDSVSLAGIFVEARIGSAYVSERALVGADGSYTLTVAPPSSIASGLLNQTIEFNIVGMPEVKAFSTRLYTGASIGQNLPLDLVFPAS